MKTSGNALMFGLGGLFLGTAIIEGNARKEVRMLAGQLQASRQGLDAARTEVAQEREMRRAAERSCDDQRRMVNEATGAVAARDPEIVKLKAEITKLRNGAAAVVKNEEMKNA
jgi:hypothetical protein